MKCPICSTEMRETGLAQTINAKVFVTLECPSCHYRLQLQKGK